MEALKLCGIRVVFDPPVASLNASPAYQNAITGSPFTAVRPLAPVVDTKRA